MKNGLAADNIQEEDVAVPSADKVIRWEGVGVVFSDKVTRTGITMSIFFCQCYKVEGCGRGLFRCCYLKAGGGGGRC